MSPVQEAATYQNLIFAREGAIAIVTLNRPERRNALSLPLMQELIRAWMKSAATARFAPSSWRPPERSSARATILPR